MEVESPLHVHVTKQTPVHVYVRKTPGQDKSKSKTRIKSAKKNSPKKIPWIPAPGKTTLRDKKGDLKWDDGVVEVCVAERDVSPKRSKKSKKGKIADTMQKALSAYENNISELLIEVETLKGELGQSQEKLQKEIDLNTSLSQEILKKAQNAKEEEVQNAPQNEKIDELAREEDEYTEIASVKEPEHVNIPSPEPQIAPSAEDLPVTTMVYGDSSILESDRENLQKQLIQAELDLQTLDFKDAAAVDKFMSLSKDIRLRLATLKRSNFDVSRLEAQRDAVIDRLAKTDSECAIVKNALYGKEADLNDLKIDTELEREKVVRLSDRLAHMEDLKARIQRELYSREGELNRSQARERVTKKQCLELQAELDAERAMNGRAKLDMEKQALKRACRHHKTKAETLKLRNEELTLDLNRTVSELAAWRERTRRTNEEVDDNIANLQETERDLQYKQQKILASERELDEKNELINSQARELGTLKVALADSKAQLQEMNVHRIQDIENAREDALSSMKALRDLPQELRQAHHSDSIERTLSGCLTRLDEALGEIRLLEERNSDLQFEADRAQKQMLQAQQGESELQIYNQKLTASEIRLDELQKALDETTEELDQARNETNTFRLRADERQHTIAALERQIEAQSAEARRSLVSEKEKYEIKERSLHNKISEYELEMTRLKGELAAIRRQKDDSEARLEKHANDMRDRLEHSEATNRSMQSYVNFLKSSYQTTFGDDLVE